MLGLSAIASHSNLSGLPFESVLVSTISCLSNQSTAAVTDCGVPPMLDPAGVADILPVAKLYTPPFW